MALAKGTIYAVVTYPTTNKTEHCNGLHIYAKQTSNLEVMTAYYEEQKARYEGERVVVLVPRETAKMMKATYYAAYYNNIGFWLRREQKKQSLLGHGEMTERELRRAMMR